MYENVWLLLVGSHERNSYLLFKEITQARNTTIDIDRANYRLTREHTEQRFSDADSQHAADIHDQVRREDRCKTPQKNYRQFTVLQQACQSRDLGGIVLGKKLIEPEVTREVIDKRRRNHDANHIDEQERQRGKNQNTREQ